MNTQREKNVDSRNIVQNYSQNVTYEILTLLHTHKLQKRCRSLLKNDNKSDFNDERCSGSWLPSLYKMKFNLSLYKILKFCKTEKIIFLLTKARDDKKIKKSVYLRFTTYTQNNFIIIVFLLKTILLLTAVSQI